MSPQQYDRMRLRADIEARLLNEAAAAEGARQLTEAQLAIIHESGWFRMFVPRADGGLQLPLPDALRLEESLAAIDGSLGWTVTLCAGAGLFAGFAATELRELLFRSPSLCIGGSGAPTGTAEIVAGGYRVSGDWQYATGGPHLTAFSANCHILEDGRAKFTPDGSSAIRSFLFLPAEVELHDDWRVMGLRATASHSFSIRDVIVPEWRSFLIRPDAATSTDPVYQYPFMQFAELTLAANFGGMALGFIECFEAGLRPGGHSIKDQLRSRKLHAAKEALAALLIPFHEVALKSWDTMLAQRSIPDAVLQQISDHSRRLAAGVRELVSDLYPFAGIAAADPGSRINRIWRDLFTATQHSLLNYPVS